MPRRGVHRPDGEGVRAAGVPRPPLRRGALPYPDRRECLGHEFRQRYQRRRRRNPAPARQDRRSVREEAAAHYPRGRLRARGARGVMRALDTVVLKLAGRRKSLTWQISLLFASEWKRPEPLAVAW